VLSLLLLLLLCITRPAHWCSLVQSVASSVQSVSGRRDGRQVVAALGAGARCARRRLSARLPRVDVACLHGQPASAAAHLRRRSVRNRSFFYLYTHGRRRIFKVLLSFASTYIASLFGELCIYTNVFVFEANHANTI